MKLAISVVVLLQLCSQLLAVHEGVTTTHLPTTRLQTTRLQTTRLQTTRLTTTRRTTRVPQCTDSDLVITVDSKLTELYIDGTRVSSGLANASKWNAADTVRVLASASVIAVKAESNGCLVAGILASGAYGTTDGSWKCTKKLQVGWLGVGFNDSAWPAATVIGSNGIFPWGNFSGINSDAKWIWTERQELFADKIVYCRKNRGCVHGTGPTCISSCSRRSDGNYQSCKGCGIYAACVGGVLTDNRPCPAGGLVWNDILKICDWTSNTCTEVA